METRRFILYNYTEAIELKASDISGVKGKE